MSGPGETFLRIDALIQAGLRLARTAPTGRILLARIADSIDLDWIPRPWGDGVVAELEAAHAEAHEEIPLREIERILAGAWGAKAGNELDDLDPEPVAVTPSSQVHRAVLDSSPVAVKVLRPGLTASVRQDLALLEGLLSPLGSAFPGLDPGAVVREFRERVLDELDLEHEATAQRRFHRALRDHPFLVVPAPVTRLAHESVLVSEWVDGVSLWQAQNPDEAAARLLLFALGGLQAGIIHADPHPDDVMVLDDGRLAILDFGATRTVQAERVEAAGAALEAFAADDADEFGAALERLGSLPASHAPALLDLLRYALGDLAGPEPARLDCHSVLAARDRLFARPQQLGEVIAAGAMPPDDLWPARGAVQAFATIARVGATGAWREVTRAALRDGWAAGLESAIAYES